MPAGTENVSLPPIRKGSTPLLLASTDPQGSFAFPRLYGGSREEEEEWQIGAMEGEGGSPLFFSPPSLSSVADPTLILNYF